MVRHQTQRLRAIGEQPRRCGAWWYHKSSAAPLPHRVVTRAIGMADSRSVEPVTFQESMKQPASQIG
jgi:hypothetical protein